MKTKQNQVGYGFAAALSLCALMVAGCSKKEETPDTSPVVPSGGQIGAPGGGPGGGMGKGGAPLAENASGTEIYQAKCGCHGQEGKGGRAPMLTGVSSRSDEDLYKIVHDGKGKMPAFGAQLTEDQIKKVVTYLKTLKS